MTLTDFDYGDTMETIAQVEMLGLKAIATYHIMSLRNSIDSDCDTGEEFGEIKGYINEAASLVNKDFVFFHLGVCLDEDPKQSDMWKRNVWQAVEYALSKDYEYDTIPVVDQIGASANFIGITSLTNELRERNAN